MKTKYLLLLFVTFIAGFFIGSLTTGRVTKSKVQKIKSMNTPKGFRENIFKIVEATEDQKPKLTPVLDSFSNIHWQLMQKSWEEQKIMFNKLDSAIQPHITSEQFELLMIHKQKVLRNRDAKDTRHSKGTVKDNE